MFQVAFNRSFSPEEEIMRKELFMAKLAMIKDHNREHDLGIHGSKMAVNFLADRTEDEVKVMLGFKG